MSQSSLKLFGVVPDKGKVGEVHLLVEYGVVVSPRAAYALTDIKKHLKETGVGTAERNSSFWKDWVSILNMSDYEMRLDQIMHYLSTYGLELFGIDSVKEGFVYIPEGVFDNSVPKKIQAIFAVEPAELIDRCFSLLNSGMALSQETIGNIISVLGECGYVITGEETIRNREAEILFYVISGKLPVGSSTLFRYLVYHFTGQSMVINDKKTNEAIKASGLKLPPLEEKQMIALAQSFNRYKDLWMAIKDANPKNRSVVNRISKLSKKHHKPMPVNVLNTLTSKYYTPAQIQEAAKNATVFQIVRVINSLRLRRANPEGSVYRIRNSRIWTSLVKPLSESHHQYTEQILINTLRQRFAEVKAYVPDFVDYSIPTTEKSFVGNIPEGTVMRFPVNKQALLLGVHWDEEHTDLDFRADSAGFSIGWNTNFRTANRGIMHSGDMTVAPKPYGASEWIYFENLNGTYNLRLNIYRAGSKFDKKFKFIIGRSSNAIVKNYSIAPEEVLTSYVVSMEDKEASLGMVYSEGDKLCYLLGTGTTGSRHIGRFGKFDSVQQDVAVKRIQSSLRLSDVVQIVKTPEQATVNLSLETLTKDSFLALFK